MVNKKDVLLNRIIFVFYFFATFIMCTFFLRTDSSQLLECHLIV
jgi:hypothetical protein